MMLSLVGALMFSGIYNADLVLYWDRGSWVTSVHGTPIELVNGTVVIDTFNRTFTAVTTRSDLLSRRGFE